MQWREERTWMVHSKHSALNVLHCTRLTLISHAICTFCENFHAHKWEIFFYLKMHFQRGEQKRQQIFVGMVCENHSPVSRPSFLVHILACWSWDSATYPNSHYTRKYIFALRISSHRRPFTQRNLVTFRTRKGFENYRLSYTGVYFSFTSISIILFFLVKGEKEESFQFIDNNTISTISNWCFSLGSNSSCDKLNRKLSNEC